LFSEKEISQITVSSRIKIHATVWGTLSDKADKNEKKLERAVAKMFKDFPPHSTKR
jgi:hypothetical protein